MAPISRPSSKLEVAQLTVGSLLDELCPFVSRADDALRRVLLDEVPFEDALAGVARAP